MLYSENRLHQRLHDAKLKWRRAMALFDAACGEETKAAALELAAAERRYMLALSEYKLNHETKPTEENHA